MAVGRVFYGVGGAGGEGIIFLLSGENLATRIMIVERGRGESGDCFVG